MAQRRRRKRGWLRTLLLFIVTPVVIWVLAFAVWFFWYDIMWVFDKGKGLPANRGQASRKIEAPRENRPREQIRDEDRKKLEEVLKERR